MNALIMTLFECGFEVYLDNGETKAKVLDEDLRFGISEELANKRVEPKNHDLDGYYRFGHSRFDTICIRKFILKNI
jgi:hypothetical protein